MAPGLPRLVAAVVLAVLIHPVAAHAQTLAVNVGDTVQMTDRSNRQLTGVVRGVGPSALTVDVAGLEQRWALADMRELWRRGDSLKNGVLIGAAAGAAGGMLGGLALSSLFEEEARAGAGPLASITMLGALIGIGAGAGIDALVRGRTLLYRDRTGSVSLSPVIAPGARGVRMTVRF